MNDGARWADLAPRLVSGVVIAFAGIAMVWQGGWVFAGALSILCGVMIWEAARMFALPSPIGVAVLAGVSVAIVAVLPPVASLPVILAAALTGATQAPREKGTYAAFAVWIIAGCAAFLVLRAGLGFAWMVWLVLVVVVSDVAGYFAGRSFGGPKFWPRLSPKKTWSGTVAGWLGGGVVGAFLAAPLDAGAMLVPLSIVVALAGQLGDIGESAVKRRQGVKDSSGLIPGHGGLLDRFDAMLAAAILVFITWTFGILPGAT
ncbi:phosphatidate cytidylyltransferase [Roseovarius sp. SYSU LYC5161]|uniref:phosphatidate cytidylyltransferase n=1 Tax=Roseovarius halophilus (ex Wu et al. 2025) TaxID=3376060 RepID=UPI0039998ECB